MEIATFARPRRVPSVVYAILPGDDTANPCGGNMRLPAVVRSADDGMTWTTVITSRVSGTESGEGYVAISVDPVDPPRLITGTDTNPL